MSMWSYPAGAIINGVETSERTVRPALPVVINDIQYFMDIFSNWSIQELNSLGIKKWEEEVVQDGYIPGVPVDIEDEEKIIRTYPHAKLDKAYALRNRAATIKTELANLDLLVPRSVEDLCRSVEDLWNVLPQINKDRIIQKENLRKEYNDIQKELELA